jgi:DNA-binding GntR family transcriptional regulator
MPSNPASPTRSDHAFAALRSRILDGDLPPGALLAESAAAQELGVSRVPVREALFTLEREGLVEFSATGRAYVKELSARDFEELFVLRQTLEPVAARLAAPVIQKDSSRLIRNIAATRKARSLSEITRLDLEFHELILELSGNARLLKLWRSIRGELDLWLGRLHRQHRGKRLDTREQTAASHEELLEAFRTQSPNTCERQMREHIVAWREWLPSVPEHE